jgi:hypothetical protein
MRPQDLTPEQGKRIVEITGTLVDFARRAGLDVQSLDVPEVGFYDRMGKRIVLSTRERTDIIDTPRSLGLLLTLAHELGHHISQNGHEAAGRQVSHDKASDILYEESSAWTKAMELLVACGMTEQPFWDDFKLMMSLSLATYTYDFAAVHHIEELVTRKGTKCPHCGSSLITVLGLESRGDLALICLKCGTHSRPHRTRAAICRALRFRTSTFANLCNCKEPMIPSMIEEKAQ